MKDLTTIKISNVHNKYVMPTYSPTIVLEKGVGLKVWDKDGKEYLDFTSGIAVTNLGHSHPNITKSILKQSDKIIHSSNLFFNELQPFLAETLVECSELDNGKCFFCNSGAEANEGMIKLARMWGHNQNRYEIITMKKSFHGRTLATLTATGQDKVKKGFDPLPKGFFHAEYNNIKSVEELINSRTVAIMMESIQGEGGIIPADQDFFHQVRLLCDREGILLLCDEVQSGIGRTGKWFGFQHYGIKPDIISTAKGLGNGFPIGAFIANSALSNIFQPGAHGTTFGGTPLACSVSLAVIKTIKDDCLLQNAEEKGSLLMSKLNSVVSSHKEWIDDVRGLGLMIGLVLKTPVKDLQRKLQEKGLLCIATAGNILRLVPPIIITNEEIDRAINYIQEACDELDESMLECLKDSK